MTKQPNYLDATITELEALYCRENGEATFWTAIRTKLKQSWKNGLEAGRKRQGAGPKKALARRKPQS